MDWGMVVVVQKWYKETINKVRKRFMHITSTFYRNVKVEESYLVPYVVLIPKLLQQTHAASVACAWLLYPISSMLSFLYDQSRSQAIDLRGLWLNLIFVYGK